MKENINYKVEEFINNEKQWQSEFIKLRKIISAYPLQEDFKWYKPCYSLNGKNVLLIHGLKDYCAILFIKGALLTDNNNLLVQQTKNTQAARQFRFKNIKEIEANLNNLKIFIEEAIAIEKSGKEIEFKDSNAYVIPKELDDAFNENPELKSAFYKLTPGRQHGYILNFSEPKQAKTRVKRITNNLAKILLGKGITDK